MAQRLSICGVNALTLKPCIEREAAMEKDPVCGMDVDPDTAAGSSEHGGKTYYFCSLGCKKQFDDDPEKFVGASSGS